MGSASGDIDNDGDEDAVLSHNAQGGYQIDILINNGDSTFSVVRKSTISNNKEYYTGPEGQNLLIDLNDDGFQNIFWRRRS